MSDAKFCTKCGVPLSLIAHAGSQIVDSKSEMTVVAARDDDEVPTVDAPARTQPVIAPPVVSSPVINQTIASPAVRPPVNYPPAITLPVVEMPVAKSQRARHILLSKPAQTILFVFIFASLPLFIPRLANMLSSKDQAYREMLPDPHELISFKSSGASDTSIPGGGGPATRTSRGSSVSGSTRR